MSCHVLLNILILNVGKRDKCEALDFVTFYAHKIIISTTQEHKC